MEFGNRIKKEMTEGIVRAILAHAGYRVVGLGIENVVREIECLTALEYGGLDFPKAMRSLPDLLVMNRDQTEKHLVEVKYRSNWDHGIFDEITEQVQLFRQVTLVYLNSSPPLAEGRVAYPSTYLRSCLVKSNGGVLEAQLVHNGEPTWVPLGEIGTHAGQWWGLRRIQDLFPQVNETREEGTLLTAVQVLRGILGA